jgi:hypothetical protein
MTQTSDRVIPAKEAADAAGITYRQLDYWARRGWVTPSVEAGLGRAGRRLYSPEDVVLLSAVARFAEGGVDVAQIGPKVGQLKVPFRRNVFLVYVTTPEPELRLVQSEAGVIDLLRSENRPVLVFDTTLVVDLLSLGDVTSDEDSGARLSIDEVRSA